MDDLAQLRTRRDEIQACISSLEVGCAAEEKRYTEYGDHLANARAMVSVGRRPEYDPEKLSEERERIAANIASIREVLGKERVKLQAAEVGVLAHLEILKAHGVVCEVAFAGEHDWEVTALFDQIGREGQWRKRRCRRCGTEQRLGRED